jgi:hypothetical protein
MLSRAALSFKVVSELSQYVIQILDRMMKDAGGADNVGFVVDAVSALSQKPQLPPVPPRKIQDLFETYLTAQMKILGIIVTVAKHTASVIRNHGMYVADQIVRLFQSCPARSVALRRDLILILRQMLNSDFRNSFHRHLDFLLDEHSLVGKGLCSHETLRDDALFSTSEFVHSLRPELSPVQTVRAIHFVIRNMQVCSFLFLFFMNNFQNFVH